MKKKKSNIDIRLWILKNIRKTFKYFFKNIFYIITLNFISFLIINKFIKTPYSIFIYNFTSSPIVFDIVYYSSFILIFYTVKIIFYGNTVYTMKTNGINDIKDLVSIIFKRFLPTLGTFIFYILAVLFFSLFLVVPGILFFFYYYFAVFLCGVGDINNKQNNTINLLNSGKALSRSFTLVKGNLIRFSIMSIVMVGIVFLLQEGFMKLLLIFDLSNFNNTILNTIRFCIYDIFVIYSALMFIKLESIENSVIEEEFRNNAEEQAMMNEARVNKFGKGK